MEAMEPNKNTTVEEGKTESLISGNINEDKVFLQRFLEPKKDAVPYSNEQRKSIWRGLFQHLEEASSKPIYVLCLSAVKIMSRDKSDVNELITEQQIDILLKLSGFFTHDEHPDTTESDINAEALMSLCNIVYNSYKAQSICSINTAIDGLFTRLKTWDANLSFDVKHYDMKLLFLISAFSVEVRARIRSDYHGLLYLVETLDMILKESPQLSPQDIKLTDQQVILLSEILKTLFNLSFESKTTDLADEEDSLPHFQRLVIVVRELLLCQTVNPANQSVLRQHCVDLLAGIPDSCHLQLTTPVMLEHDEPKDFEYEGRDMSAVVVLIAFLKQKLDTFPKVPVQNESLSPILTALVKSARGVRVLRKFLRSIILPPLRDVMTRPESGNTIRNQLCQLLTTPTTTVRDLTAEFLFVLCKRSAERMIKYTGYGNAAGLFANRGRRDSKDDEDVASFSSDSDTDTEEYIKVKDSINPVVGCYEPPRPDATENMTEEQKEYEAMEIVKLMDKLAKGGIVQPCRLGPDGRPEPVDHILQLQEDNPICLAKTHKK